MNSRQTLITAQVGVTQHDILCFIEGVDPRQARKARMDKDINVASLWAIAWTVGVVALWYFGG